MTLLSFATASANPPKAVTFDRPKTFFYPIGWMAIVAGTGWFVWMIVA